MGGEKSGSKSSGFFNLFDWNRKLRKKVISSGSSSPAERTKNGKRAGESVLHYQLGLIDKDEITGAASMRGSSDYSCASSVTDEEGHVMKAPGVVARLMGLDSLPTSGVSEPYSTPLFDPKTLSGNHGQNKTPSCYMNDQLDCPRNPVDLRTAKMPSSPIERFQTEMVPPRSAKSFPIAHQKLCSPIKNPGFISPKNAAHIMEAAVKILEPGLQPSTSRSRTPLFRTSSVPLKVHDSKDISPAPQRLSRLPETSRRLVESSSLRSPKGQSLSKSWNSSDDTVVSKSFLDTEEFNQDCSKGKGKSVSLAVQAKVNVQRREGINFSNKNVGGRKNREQCKVGQQFKSQTNNQRSRQLIKESTASSSSVLRQNNQKQNSLTSRDKLTKNKAGDAASAKNKYVNNAPGSCKVGYRKGDLLIADVDSDDGTSGMRNYPRKKRLIERESYSTKTSLVDKVYTDGLEKSVQQNIVIDERSSWLDDNGRNGSDIVSFTFTSPLVKPISECQLSGENNGVGSSNKQKPFLRSNVIGGDALNLLLEQKLKELTSRIDLSSCDLLSSSSTTFQEPACNGHSPDSAPLQMNQEFLFSSTDDLSCISDCAITLPTDQVLSKSSLQEAERAKPSCSDGAPKENHHPSPLSILDASFSNESCNSSESWESTGSKMCSSSAQRQELDSINPTFSAENELDLTDSASSSFMETMYDENVFQTSKAGYTKESKQDLEFVREILSKIGSIFVRTFKTLEAIVDVSEHKANGTEMDGLRRTRKLLVDCVNECLDKKYGRYFQAGYCMWAKGAMVVSKDLTEEIYKEILQWKSMGGRIVDELVDKDMSTDLGRWVDFEIEVFEAGAEMEREIFHCLIDEIVCDILSKGVPSGL